MSHSKRKACPMYVSRKSDDVHIISCQKSVESVQSAHTSCTNLPSISSLTPFMFAIPTTSFSSSMNDLWLPHNKQEKVHVWNQNTHMLTCHYTYQWQWEILAYMFCDFIVDVPHVLAKVTELMIRDSITHYFRNPIYIFPLIERYIYPLQ